MRTSLLLPALLLLAFGTGPARAVDLSKIDRTIAKEPAYQGKPQYCLVVFGPEAKGRVWLVRDGETLYVGPPGDHDLTRAKRVRFGPVKGRPDGLIRADVGDIPVPDAKTAYTNLAVSGFPSSKSDSVSVKVGKQGWYAGWDSNDLVFAKRPQDAPIIHFGGPLTLGLLGHAKQWARGQEKARVTAFIGTPGMGDGSFARFVASAVPESAKLQAEIEFPPLEARAKPVTVRLVLKPDN